MDQSDNWWYVHIFSWSTHLGFLSCFCVCVGGVCCIIAVCEWRQACVIARKWRSEDNVENSHLCFYTWGSIYPGFTTIWLSRLFQTIWLMSFLARCGLYSNPCRSSIYISTIDLSTTPQVSRLCDGRLPAQLSSFLPLCLSTNPALCLVCSSTTFDRIHIFHFKYS